MRWPLLSLVVLVACPAPRPAAPDAGLPVNMPEDAGGPCLAAFPEQLDFGEIDADTTALTRVRLTNHSRDVLVPRLAPLPAPFTIDPLELAPLAPGASSLLSVRFSPTDGRLHFATLEVETDGGCGLTLPIRGLGRGRFEITPALLEFGHVEPGSSESLELTLTNTMRTAVVFDRVEVRAVAGAAETFTISPAAPLTIAPQSAPLLRVTASPATYGSFSALLVFLGPSGVFQIPLQALGGAPRALLWPTTVDVPKMDFTERSRPPSFVDRSVWLRNVADGGMFFSELQLEPPFFEARREDGGLTGEVTPISFSAALWPGHETELRFRVLPSALGRHRYQVNVFTNDPVNREQRFEVSVNALALPACALQHPLSVAFTAAPGGGSTGVVRFENASGLPCVLDAVHLESANFGFAIIDGGVDQLELAPGERHEVWLSGPDAGALQGANLTFHVLGPNSDVKVINLVAPE